MNYLAHFLLSGEDPDIQLGGFLGDFVKGPLNGDYPPSIEMGIQLHRTVDGFTDSHPAIKSCTELFDPEFRRYGGIMMDIACDHFLSLHWDHYYNVPLDTYTAQLYSLLEKQSSFMPANAKRMAGNLVQHKILNHYHDPTYLKNILARIGDRFTHENPLQQSYDQIELHRERLLENFQDFFPEVRAFAEDKRDELKSS